MAQPCLQTARRSILTTCFLREIATFFGHLGLPRNCSCWQPGQDAYCLKLCKTFDSPSGGGSASLSKYYDYYTAPIPPSCFGKRYSSQMVHRLTNCQINPAIQPNSKQRIDIYLCNFSAFGSLLARRCCLSPARARNAKHRSCASNPYFGRVRVGLGQWQLHPQYRHKQSMWILAYWGWFRG